MMLRRNMCEASIHEAAINVCFIGGNIVLGIIRSCVQACLYYAPGTAAAGGGLFA
ncbi:hypothetical protein J40TS1_22530 [Paenibacillus montaniterrae]|uniref:Uncharacterized protein n=1 Tax=Paenibacillus montaniterrae TaxID=429341 RepID=A0A920CX71_9BACL|nr:hypothetical protein J40TS1_22530 [Paenibacillus montaniterrae]